jgi:Flp pilus assembly pilin Flp
MRPSSSLHRFGSDRRGAGLVEYLLCVGAVALLALAGLRLLGGQIDGKSIAQAACIQSLSCGVSATGSAAASDAALPVHGAVTLDGAQGQAGAGRSILGRVLDFGRGFVVDGLWGTVTGLWHVVTHPVETVQGLWYAVTHPIATVRALRDAVVEAWNENPERFLGQAVFEVVTLPVAALKGARATRLSRAARTANGAERGDAVTDTARLATGADARRTRTTAELAALPGRVVRADPGTVQGRRALALDALMNGPPPMSLERAQSHMQGIDFSQPVEIVELSAADELIQYNVPGQRGKYFGPRGTAAESLGIDPAGRVLETFRGPDQPILAIRSTAAEIESFVDRNGAVIPGGRGGGVQYKVPDSGGFTRQP